MSKIQFFILLFLVVILVSLLLGMVKKEENAMGRCIKEHKANRYCENIIVIGLYK